MSAPRRVLIVSPNWPPVSCPDLHRARQAVSWLPEFGWEPIILHVDPAEQEGIKDPELADALPPGLRTVSVGCWPRWLSSWAGIRSISLRGYCSFDRAGRRAIAEFKPDVIYFTTTQFLLLRLAAAWKRRFRIPVVVDFQDPWYKAGNVPASALYRSWKYKLSQFLAKRSESRVLSIVDHVTVVSSEYSPELRRRYPFLHEDHFTTLPFGAGEADFAWLESRDRPAPQVEPEPGNWVFVGRLGPIMERPLRALIGGLSQAKRRGDAGAADVRLLFVGTDYAPAGRSGSSLGELVDEFSASQWVEERPGRVPYFEALRLLRAAARVIVLGSHDPAYVPSKLYQCLFSGTPVLAVVSESSPAHRMLESAGIESVIALGPDAGSDIPLASGVIARIGELNGVAGRGRIDAFSSREMTRRLVEVFDRAGREASGA